MYVCIYVCVYVSMYVCMYLCMCVSMYVCMYVYVYVYKLSILVYSNHVLHTCMFVPLLSSPRSFDWLEDKKGSKKTRLPAKQFIDTSLAQIQRQIRDEQTFPTKFGGYSTVKLVLFLDPLQNRIGLVSLEVYTSPGISILLLNSILMCT